MFSMVIADDEHRICEGISAIVNSHMPDITVTNTFFDGDSCYQFLEKNHVDICLLDIQMPGKSGLDIAQLLHRQKSGTFIILITAYRQFEYAQSAVNLGIRAFLTKPVDSKQLVNVINQAKTELKKEHFQQQQQLSALQNLLRILATSDALSCSPPLFLLDGTILLEELSCTEVLLELPNIAILPQTKQDCILNYVHTILEIDSKDQTRVCYRSNEETVVCLVFSKDIPDLSFLSDSRHRISDLLGNSVGCSYRFYKSFADYKIFLSYPKHTERFFNIFAESGPQKAKAYLMEYMLSLSPSHLLSFVEHLRNHHQLPIPDQIDSPSDIADIFIAELSSVSSTSQLIEATIKYIHQNFHNPNISLSNVANEIGVSVAYLSRSFKKATGNNFSEFLISVRMNAAKQLLRTTTMSIASIAESVGYTNPAYFRNSFKNMFEMTPIQFRHSTSHREK